MKTKMDPEKYLPLVAVAKEICAAIDERAKHKAIPLLQRIYPLLLRLVQLASEIPGYPDIHNFKKDRMAASSEWRLLYNSLQKKFGKYDRYKEVFDPYDKREKLPTYGSISDDISDLYQDLKDGLQRWEMASLKTKRRILSNWRFQFEIHWGEHATSALRAIYFVLFRNVDGKDGLPVGLQKSASRK